MYGIAYQLIVYMLAVLICSDRTACRARFCYP